MTQASEMSFSINKIPRSRKEMNMFIDEFHASLAILARIIRYAILFELKVHLCPYPRYFQAGGLPDNDCLRREGFDRGRQTNH